MSAFIIDASVAIKWVIDEDGTPAALALRHHHLAAPDLLMQECANILCRSSPPTSGCCARCKAHPAI